MVGALLAATGGGGAMLATEERLPSWQRSGVAPSGPSGGVGTELYWAPTAAGFWQINRPAISRLFDNGHCTQLAAEKRPDVLRRIVEGTVQYELGHHQPELLPNFNASNWMALARRFLIPTGRQPRLHSLMVFQPGALDAGPDGHIAYVVARGRRSFRIAEMNAPRPWVVSYEALAAATASQPGIGFVY